MAGERKVDVGRESKSLTTKVIENGIDLTQYPTKIDEKDYHGKQLAYGDLHGNVLNIIHFAIRRGVIQLSAPHYLELVNIYKNFNSAAKEDKIKYLNRFKEILEKNCSVETGNLPFLQMIGDVLADRGGSGEESYGNDIFQLLWFNIWKTKIKTEDRQGKAYEVLFSNHDAEAFKAVSKGLDNTARIPSSSFGTLNRLIDLIEDKVVEKDEVMELFNDYASHVKAISYSYDNSNDRPVLKIANHAPVGMETIKALAKYYKVVYADKSAEQICQTIDRINEKFSLHLSSGILAKTIAEEEALFYKKFPHVGLGEGSIPITFPLLRLIWNRAKIKDERGNEITLDDSKTIEIPPQFKDVGVIVEHGHDGRYKTDLPFFSSLDHDSGKYGLGDKEKEDSEHIYAISDVAPAPELKKTYNEKLALDLAYINNRAPANDDIYQHYKRKLLEAFICSDFQANSFNDSLNFIKYIKNQLEHPNEEKSLNQYDTFVEKLMPPLQKAAKLFRASFLIELAARKSEEKKGEPKARTDLYFESLKKQCSEQGFIVPRIDTSKLNAKDIESLIFFLNSIGTGDVKKEKIPMLQKHLNFLREGMNATNQKQIDYEKVLFNEVCKATKKPLNPPGFEIARDNFFLTLAKLTDLDKIEIGGDLSLPRDIAKLLKQDSKSINELREKYAHLQGDVKTAFDVFLNECEIILALHNLLEAQKKCANEELKKSAELLHDEFKGVLQKIEPQNIPTVVALLNAATECVNKPGDAQAGEAYQKAQTDIEKILIDKIPWRKTKIGLICISFGSIMTGLVFLGLSLASIYVSGGLSTPISIFGIKCATQLIVGGAMGIAGAVGLVAGGWNYQTKDHPLKPARSSSANFLATFGITKNDYYGDVIKCIKNLLKKNDLPPYNNEKNKYSSELLKEAKRCMTETMQDLEQSGRYDPEEIKKNQDRKNEFQFKAIGKISIKENIMGEKPKEDKARTEPSKSLSSPESKSQKPKR